MGIELSLRLIGQKHREQPAVLSGLSEPESKNLDVYQGVQIPAEDRIKSEFFWGGSSADLITGGKKQRMVLTDAGRKVAQDNIDLWQQELQKEGKTFTAENMIAKYRDASEIYPDKNAITGLIKNSIRMKISHLTYEVPITEPVRKPAPAPEPAKYVDPPTTPTRKPVSTPEPPPAEKISLIEEAEYAWEHVQRLIYVVNSDIKEWKADNEVATGLIKRFSFGIILGVAAVGILDLIYPTLRNLK